METQIKFSFPGLANEAKVLIAELNLPDILNKEINKKYSKMMWKKMVKNEVIRKCENEIWLEIKEIDKLEEIKKDNKKFTIKDYLKNMNLEDARTKFKLRTKMLDVKFNYKHMPRNEKSLWKCDSCQTSIETQSHIMWCPSYSELRAGKDIQNDKDLIEYVTKVMKIRERLNITK